MNDMILSGRHISLKLFEREYEKFMYDCYTDLESRKLWTTDTSININSEYLSNLRSSISNYYHVFMIIVNNRTNEPVGFIYSHDFDIPNCLTYTSIYITKNYRAKGASLESGILFYNYLFSNFQIRKIYCTVFAYNNASLKFLNGLGFKIEGQLRKHKYYNGEYHDMMYLSLTKEKFACILSKYSKYIFHKR